MKTYRIIYRDGLVSGELSWERVKFFIRFGVRCPWSKKPIAVVYGDGLLQAPFVEYVLVQEGVVGKLYTR